MRFDTTAGQLDADILYRTRCGSHTYNSATPTRDIDRRGICLVRQRSHHLGLSNHPFGQQAVSTSLGDDTVTYEFRKAMRLFAEGNHMVQMLFTNARQHEWIAAAFEPVLAARGQLVTRCLAQKLASDGRHQLEDLRRQRLRLANRATAAQLLGKLGSNRRAMDNRSLGYDTKQAMHAVRTFTMAQKIMTTAEVRVARPDAELLLAVRAGASPF